MIELPALDYYWLGMNVDHPNFRDIRVRRAVQYAVNVPEILDAAFFGVVDRATGFQAANSLGHRESNLVSERDVEKARALLDEAGVGGMSVTLTILNATVWTTMAQVIQANLAEVGIEVEILVYDDGTFWTLGLESEGDAWKDIQMYLQLYSGLPDPSFQAQWFVPEQVGVWNWERWEQPRVRRAQSAPAPGVRRGDARRAGSAHAGIDGGVRRLRLSHQRPGGHSRARRHQSGVAARRHESLPARLHERRVSNSSKEVAGRSPRGRVEHQGCLVCVNETGSCGRVAAVRSLPRSWRESCRSSRR